jgi:dienelactone hydrolase
MRRLLALCLVVPLLAACGGGSAGARTATGGSAATNGASASGAAAGGGATPAEPVAPCVDPRDPDLTSVRLRPAAGREVGVVLAGTGPTALVFSNMSGETLCDWLPTALIYAKQGYRVALYEYSSHEQSPAADLTDVVGELRHRGATRIALVGASMGGTTSIAVANSVHAVAVFVLSAPASYGLMDAVTAVARVTVPSWFGVGELDAGFVQSAKDLYEHSGAKNKHLEILPSGAHGTALLGAAVDRKLADFLHANAPAG